jgi:hypothetical protein
LFASNTFESFFWVGITTGMLIYGLEITINPYNLYNIVGTGEPGYSPLMKTYE